MPSYTESTFRTETTTATGSVAVAATPRVAAILSQTLTSSLAARRSETSVRGARRSRGSCLGNERRGAIHGAAGPRPGTLVSGPTRVLTVTCVFAGPRRPSISKLLRGADRVAQKTGPAAACTSLACCAGWAHTLLDAWLVISVGDKDRGETAPICTASSTKPVSLRYGKGGIVHMQIRGLLAVCTVLWRACIELRLLTKNGPAHRPSAESQNANTRIFREPCNIVLMGAFWARAARISLFCIRESRPCRPHKRCRGERKMIPRSMVLAPLCALSQLEIALYGAWGGSVQSHARPIRPDARKIIHRVLAPLRGVAAGRSGQVLQKKQ